MWSGTVLAVLGAFSTLFADTYGSGNSVVEWDSSTQCCRPPWGQSAHSACTLDLTWETIAEKLTNDAIVLKTGGLGTSIQAGGPGISNVEVWLCMEGHECDIDGESFCFVYDETKEKFVAWGLNSQLKLYTADVGSGSGSGSGVELIGDNEQFQLDDTSSASASSARATSLTQEEAGDFIYTEIDY